MNPLNQTKMLDYVVFLKGKTFTYSSNTVIIFDISYNKEDTPIVLEAKVYNQIKSILLEDGKMTLDKETNIITIKNDRAEARLPNRETNFKLSIIEEELQESFKYNLKALQKATNFVGENTARWLDAVILNEEGGIVATDGYKAYSYNFDFNAQLLENTMWLTPCERLHLLPPEFIKSIPNVDDVLFEVEIGFKGERVVFRGNGIEIISSLYAYELPKYELLVKVFTFGEFSHLNYKKPSINNLIKGDSVKISILNIDTAYLEYYTEGAYLAEALKLELADAKMANLPNNEKAHIHFNSKVFDLVDLLDGDEVTLCFSKHLARGHVKAKGLNELEIIVIAPIVSREEEKGR